MAYSIKTVSLAAATTGPVELVPPGAIIAEVAVLNFPAGVSFQLALGSSAPFTVSAPFSLEPTGEDIQRHGLYYQVPAAAPGVTVELIVGYADRVGGA